MTGTLTTEKATCFYDENKMTHKCTFSEDGCKIFKKTRSLKRYPNGILL